MGLMACPAVVDISTRGKLELRPAPGVEALMAAYTRWWNEGLFSMIFPNHPNMTLPEFLAWNDSPGVTPVGCYCGGELVGIGWINQVLQVADKKVAEVGAGFFKDTPISQWRRGLEQMIEYGFVDRGCDAVYGTSPRPNRMACALAIGAGMRETGHIPLFTSWEGKAVDAVIFSLRREEWENNYDRAQ